ncbi:hypothetical protein ABPG74_013737 [Tetrahymena malaccensis]
MYTESGKKKVRIQLENQVHSQMIVEEEDISNTPYQAYSKIPQIKHLKELNLYQFRPNADIDGDYDVPKDQNLYNSNNFYEHLEKWKKDLTLKTAQNADELNRMRKDHENSLKFDQKFPQVNIEIIDSINRDPNMSIQDNSINQTCKSMQNLSPRSSNQFSKNKKNLSVTSFSMNQLGNNFEGNMSLQTENNKIYNDKSSQSSINAQGKSVKFIQSNESIQRELNKKLVNNLIFSRVQRTLEDNKINTKSSRADKNDYQTNINRQRAEDIFKTEMSHFSNQTLANFKSLMQTFRRSNNLIEYEDLSRQLATYLNRPQGIFQSQDQKNELMVSFKNEKEQKYQFKYMEKILLDNYMQLRQEINSRVNQIKDMRQYSNQLQNQVTDINEKTRLYTLQVQKDIENQEKSVDQSKKQSAAQITKIKKSIQKIQEDQEAVLQDYKQQKNQLLSQLNQNQQQLILNEKEIKTYKEKKDITRNMLKTLYLETLKNDQTLQKQSMVWIVRALLNINEDVSSSDIFPQILDNQSIQYLVEYAALESNMDQVLSSIKLKSDDQISQIQNDQFDQEYLNTQQQYSLVDMKERVQKIARKTNLKIRKPIFTSSCKNEYILAWENAQDVQAPQEIAFSLAKIPPSKTDLVNQNKDAREQMKQIKLQQKKMKEGEANRLIDQYLQYKDEKKREELKQIFNILFGELEGHDYFKQFQKKYIHLQFQIKNNKTFTFTRTNLTPNYEKEEQVLQKITPRKGAVGSQTILQYRKGQNEEENAQLDQFDLVKQVGKVIPKNKLNNKNEKTEKIQVPQDILQKHNLLKSRILNGEQTDKMFSSTFYQLSSTPNFDNIEKSQSKQSFNRKNQLYASLNNIPPSLTNLSVDTQINKEINSQRSQNSNLYFLTQKQSTQSELESPLKYSNQNFLASSTKLNSLKKSYF